MGENNENEKYAYLNRLSTQQLEELLRADIESPESGDESVIFHILEVIEKREKEHPTGRLADAGEAWAEFQQYYNIPEGEGMSLYPTSASAETKDPLEQADAPSTQGRSRRASYSCAWRRIGVIAATAAVFFALLIGAQAAGIDVFGALGRWTDKTFHFVSSSGETAQNNTDVSLSLENVATHDSLQDALGKCGITKELAPNWYPTGFEASEPQILNGKHSDTVHITFHDENEGFFNINITRYQSASNLETGTFEKDGTPVEQYISGTKLFYIISNVDTLLATWSDGLLVVNISGNLQIDDIKGIIDSIGG